MAAPSKSFRIYYEQCDHYQCDQVVDYGAATVIKNKQFCSHCLIHLSPVELFSRAMTREMTPPLKLRRDDVRDRTNGIWRRLRQNPGLIASREQVEPVQQHDINYLYVIMLDMYEDIFRRWTPRSGLRQPTVAERRLFIQVRDVVQEGFRRQLDAIPLSQKQLKAGGYTIYLTPRETLFDPVEPAALADGERSCPICYVDFFQEDRNWLPIYRSTMPIRLPCCNKIMCRVCAAQIAEADPPMLVPAPGGRIWEERPCFYCGKENSPCDALLGPCDEEEHPQYPSAPWMEIFRPTE